MSDITIAMVGEYKSSNLPELEFKPKGVPIPYSLPPVVVETMRILQERHRQKAKWGEQDYSDEKWLRVLVEEVGEAAKEMNDRAENTSSVDHSIRRLYLEDLRAEIIQCAAVACAWSEKLTVRINALS